MNTSERIARVIFGGDHHDLTRRAVSGLVPDTLIQQLGLARRTSHLGTALTLIGAGAALGVVGYHVLGPNSRPVRARILERIHTMSAEAKSVLRSNGAAKPDAETSQVADAEPSRRAPNGHTQDRHS